MARKRLRPGAEPWVRSRKPEPPTLHPDLYSVADRRTAGKSMLARMASCASRDALSARPVDDSGPGTHEAMRILSVFNGGFPEGYPYSVPFLIDVGLAFRRCGARIRCRCRRPPHQRARSFRSHGHASRAGRFWGLRSRDSP